MAARDSDATAHEASSAVLQNEHAVQSAGAAGQNDNDTPEMDLTTVVPDTGEGGKLKMIVQLLKRCLGVKDLGAMYVCFVHYSSFFLARV